MIKLFITILLSTQVFSATWSEASISLLRGNEVSEFNSPNRPGYEITFQYANGWEYGDNFIWVDWFDYFKSSNDKVKPSLYGEISPRFSFGKILRFHHHKRFVSDILLANTFEFGRAEGVLTRSRLHGIGVDFGIPWFDFFQYNFYLRDNLDLKGETFQSTIAYRKTFKLSDKVQFFWAAYIDIIHGGEGEGSNFVKSHWHTAQQLLFDMGALLSFKRKTLYAGLEFQYWSDKFGNEGFGRESNFKYMISWFL